MGQGAGTIGNWSSYIDKVRLKHPQLYPIFLTSDVTSNEWIAGTG